MKRTILTAAGLILLGLSLASCRDGGGGGSGGGATVTPPTTTRFSDQFGTNFSSGFQANNNSEPRAVTSSDLSVNPSAQPVAIPANPTQ